MSPLLARAGLAVGLVLVAESGVAQQQQPVKVYRIGYVTMGPPGPITQPQLDAFRQSLSDFGYVEGRNVIIDVRYAQGQPERLPGIISELLRVRVDVFMVGATVSALAAKNATTTTPIVFAYLSDPVASGVVASLARPGGNITGTTGTMFGAGVGTAGKWIGLLKEAAPDVSHVGVLLNPRHPANASFTHEVEVAARSSGANVEMIEAWDEASLDRALAAISASHARGIIVAGDPLFSVHRDKIIRFAATKRLPAMYFSKQHVEAGGLMSYGISIEDSYRRAAAYVDKILKGAKPGELPIEQPTRFELVINLRTARALGLAIPQSVMARADVVIE